MRSHGVPQPCCTCGVRVPTSCVPHVPEAQGSFAPGPYNCTRAVRVPASGVPYTPRIVAPQAASGGAFSFPHLNLTVPAAAGRALLWPHLMDTDLATPDMRTEHEGTEVIAGVRLQPYVPQAATLRAPGCSPTCPNPTTCTCTCACAWT